MNKLRDKTTLLFVLFLIAANIGQTQEEEKFQIHPWVVEVIEKSRDEKALLWDTNYKQIAVGTGANAVPAAGAIITNHILKRKAHSKCKKTLGTLAAAIVTSPIAIFIDWNLFVIHTDEIYRYTDYGKAKHWPENLYEEVFDSGTQMGREHVGVYPEYQYRPFVQLLVVVENLEDQEAHKLLMSLNKNLFHTPLDNEKAVREAILKSCQSETPSKYTPEECSTRIFKAITVRNPEP